MLPDFLFPASIGFLIGFLAFCVFYYFVPISKVDIKEQICFWICYELRKLDAREIKDRDSRFSYLYINFMKAFPEDNKKISIEDFTYLYINMEKHYKLPFVKQVDSLEEEDD